MVIDIGITTTNCIITTQQQLSEIETVGGISAFRQQRIREMASSTVAAPFAENVQKIIAGGWSVDSQDGDWRLPSKQILIFVSSTFTDTHLERNILAEKILPNLQTLARKANMTVTLTDMR